MQKATRRATPLAQEDRQAAIIAAVTPLLVERGSAVTSRELAEAAGVAEGTLFRAFGSKDKLIHAVLVTFVDLESLEARIADVPDPATLEVVVGHLIDELTRQVKGMFTIASAIEQRVKQKHIHRDDRDKHLHELIEILARQLEPYADELVVTPLRAARFIRGVCFSSAFPQGEHSEDDGPLSAAELATLVVHGISRPSP